MIAPPDTQAPTAPGTPGPRRVIARFDRQPDDLLSEFAIHGRQDCFEEIVRRYGAMVLNVCMQVTRHRQDAEDATQIVFLVLAERLRAGEKIISPGRWLQQVARRVALDIRRSRSRRRRRERQQAKEELIHPPEVSDDSAARLVREELDRVPAKYRIPLVLHYFNGQNFSDAARELGIKPSTLGVRLFRGRKLLAERLARRGVTLSTVALATLLAAVIRRSISDALVKSVAHLSLKGGASAGTGPVAMSKGLAALAGSSALKLVLTAGLLAAAAVGARAAVQWHADGPLLDFRSLLPRFPDLRTHLPHFRADAGDPAHKSTDGSNPDDPKPSANPFENWVAVPHGNRDVNGLQPYIPTAPPDLGTQATAPSRHQLAPQLFQAPPALARHDSSTQPANVPTLPGHKVTPNLFAPPVAPGHFASTAAGAPAPTLTPTQPALKPPTPAFPRNAAGMAPGGLQNASGLNGGDSSGTGDGSDPQSSLFGPNSLQGPASPNGMLGGSLVNAGTPIDTTLLGSSQAVDSPAPSVVTPEPAGLTIVITAAGGLLLRRRRK